MLIEVILGGWIVVVAVTAICLSGRLAGWLQKSRQEQTSTHAIRSRYQLGIIFGAIGALFVSTAVVLASLDVFPGGLPMFVGIPCAFVAFAAAQSKLTHDSDQRGRRD